MLKSKIFNILAIALVGLGFSSNSLANPKTKQQDTKYHQMYVIGDSLFDSGVLVGATRSLIPLHRSAQLDDPYYQNRSFSTGPVAPELVAAKLHLTLTPGWEIRFGWDSWWNGYTFSHIGNTYAAGGALSYPLDFSTVDKYEGSRVSIDKQTDALIKQHHDLQANDLVILEGSNNDILSATHNHVSEQLQVRTINNAINSEVASITKLINHNIKHIVVTNLIDFSKAPEFKNLPNEEPVAQKLVTEYNSKWDEAISNLQKTFPNVIKKYDLYNSFKNDIASLEQQGVNVTQQAIESNLGQLLYGWGGRVKTKYVNGATKDTLNKFLFLDDIHPGKKVHEIMANEMYDLVKKW